MHRLSYQYQLYNNIRLIIYSFSATHDVDYTIDDGLITLNSMMQTVTVEASIFEDTIFEMTEEFHVGILHSPWHPEDPGLEIVTPLTRVFITDNESMLLQHS